MANLTRSVFFRESDHGRSKAEVLTRRLAELNPDLRTHAEVKPPKTQETPKQPTAPAHKPPAPSPSKPPGPANQQR